MRNVLNKSCIKIRTHILCSITFSRISHLLWDNVEKCGEDWRDTNHVTIWRTRVACWISKATCTQAHAHVRAQTQICNIYFFSPQHWCYVTRTLCSSHAVQLSTTFLRFCPCWILGVTPVHVWWIHEPYLQQKRKYNWINTGFYFCTPSIYCDRTQIKVPRTMQDRPLSDCSFVLYSVSPFSFSQTLDRAVRTEQLLTCREGKKDYFGVWTQYWQVSTGVIMTTTAAVLCTAY